MYGTVSGNRMYRSPRSINWDDLILTGRGRQTFLKLRSMSPKLNTSKLFIDFLIFKLFTMQDLRRSHRTILFFCFETPLFGIRVIIVLTLDKGKIAFLLGLS